MILVEKEIRHFHLCGGSGSGARGFNLGSARLGNIIAKPRCIGSVDIDPRACRDFEQLTGVPATLLDLMDERQYRAFHNCAPPRGWREATPDDIRRAQRYQHPHVGFTSAPCKGNSGLLPEAQAQTERYQALNSLAERAMWLFLEANADDPVEIILFENVPRIATRSRPQLDRIIKLLDAYGYASQETVHDCGEIGGLGQTRKRYLLIARHRPKVPNFLYEPVKYPLRGIGDVLDKLPVPLSGLGGPLHRMPALQWQTWVRLAFVEAGSDWRSLNKLTVEDGVLKDFGITPEYGFNGVLGVNRWSDPGPTISTRSMPTTGGYAIADPRTGYAIGAHENKYAVGEWNGASRTVIGTNKGPGSGAISVADPRVERQARRTTFGVADWGDTSNSIRGESLPSNGTFAVADPRVNGHPKSVQLGVRRWRGQPAGVVTGKMIAGGGPHSVADPRLDGVRFNHVYRVVRYDEAAPAVAGPGGPAGGLSVADPRAHSGFGGKGKYQVAGFKHPAGTVIAASTTGHGAFGVADPRPAFVREGSKRTDSYLTSQGYYGVLRYDETGNAVTGFGKHDNGFNSVADPRMSAFSTSDQAKKVNTLPGARENVVCIIRALDGTWHRPITTLECAALQSMFDPEKYFTSPEDYWDLDGMSDSAKRERIGNAVPSDAAKGMASTIYRCLLSAWSGTTFELSSEPIWVQPVALALSAAR